MVGLTLDPVLVRQLIDPDLPQTTLKAKVDRASITCKVPLDTITNNNSSSNHLLEVDHMEILVKAAITMAISEALVVMEASMAEVDLQDGATTTTTMDIRRPCVRTGC